MCMYVLVCMGVCVCMCMHVCLCGSLHCMNENVSSLNLYLSFMHD